MLGLKLALAPALIGLASLAARRWGPQAAGWLASLPVVGGPILLVIALQHTRVFSAHAAASATAGLVSLAAFTATYAWAGRRGHRWWTALLVGWVAFAAVTVVLWLLDLSAVAGVAAVLLAVAAARWSLGEQPHVVASGRRLPYDPLGRMLAGAALVLAVSGAAAVLGPGLAGLVTPFPVITSILAAATHVTEGRDGLARYADTMLRGLPSFALFTAVLALALPRTELAWAFGLASVACLASHALLITEPWRRAVVPG